MSKFPNVFRKVKIRIMPIMLLSVIVLNARAQNSLTDKLNGAARLVGATAGLVNSVRGLVDASKRSTEDYNKNVTVIRGYNGNTPPPVDGKPAKIKFKNGEFTNLGWSPISYFDGQLFPSEIISMATYERKNELVGEMEALSRPLGFRLYPDKAQMTFRWEIESVEKSYFDKVTGTAVCTQAKREFNLMPDIPWNFDVLAKQESAKPLTIYFRIFDEDGNKMEKTVTVFMRSINDCIYAYKQNKLDFLFTAFIQVSHPEIDKILKQALDTKYITSVKGYQGGPGYVELQVAAIWKVLHDRGFKYSSITNTDGSTENILCQAVRTFDKAIKTNQANCVDGTVVFATILKRIGIHTVLVTTSDHCFLGFYPDEDSFRQGDASKLCFLETTMLANSVFIDKAKTAAQRKVAYLNQYATARKYADKNFITYMNAKNALIVDVDKSSFVKSIPF